MAFERQWAAVPPQLFAANGNRFGLITLADTAGFKVKQSAALTAIGQPTLPVQVKRVLSPTQLVVGTINNAQIGTWTPLDISAYTVARNASISAEQQDKSKLQRDDIEIATYEQEPTVARRVVFVDQYGNFYDDDNPLPATFSGTITVGEIIVKGTNGNTIEPNPDGSLNVVVESVPSSNTTVVNTWDEALAVVSGMSTTIVTYTVPSLKNAVLQRAAFSGENIARFDILVNGVTQDTARTMFGTSLTGMFDFTSGNDSGLLLNTGDTVFINVLHNRPSTANFEGRIQVLEILV